MVFTPLLGIRQRRIVNIINQHARLVRNTKKARRQIYEFTSEQFMSAMRVIGRLREVSFRHDGGGTGKVNDIDYHDLNESHPYKQLIVVDPKKEEIIGGYRHIDCKDAPIDEHGVPDLSMALYFLFSQQFMKGYFPFAKELGRSFIQPEYQAGKGAIFSLDNLWDGLGAVIVESPEIKYLLGKITEYEHKNIRSHDIIHTWMLYNFPDEEKLIVPKPELIVPVGKLGRKDQKELDRIVAEHDDITKQYKALNQYIIKEKDEHIPPLFGAYATLSPTMKVFGTAKNKDFGNVYETGILITIEDVYEHVLKRYTEYEKIK